MNQGGKYVEALLQLANQTSNLLSPKEVEQVDVLLDKCIGFLPECERTLFVKVLASFFRLFLHCPFASTEVFYKKYYAILKEGFILKGKNAAQQKCQCLILTLLDVADKYYSPAFAQAIKNSKDLTYQQIIQSILTINVKGGLNLKAYLALLRKFIEKDRENMRIQEALTILKDLFHKFMGQMDEDLKKTSKIYDNYVFKFFIINALFEQLESRFEPQSIAFSKEVLRQYESKYEQSSSLKSLVFLQFLSINQHKIPIMEVIHERRMEPANDNGLKRRRNYIVDVLSVSLLLEGVNRLINNRSGQYLIETLHLLRNQYKSIASITNLDETRHNIGQSLLQQGCCQLEQVIIQLLVSMRLHLASLDLAKTSPLSLLKALIAINSPFSQQFSLNNGKNSHTLDGQFYNSLMQSGLGCKTRVCLALLYFSLFSSSVPDYHSAIVLQSRLFSHLRNIIEQSTPNNPISHDFIEQLYLFMSFKTSKSEYLAKVHGTKQDETTIFKEILDLYINYSPEGMAEEVAIDQFLQCRTNKLKSEKYTFQGLLDLITGLMQNDQNTASFKDQAQGDSQFSALSMVLFDKINIKPKTVNRIAQEISFTIEREKRKCRFCLSLFRKLYDCDGLMRSNPFFMQGAPQIEAGERVMVVALKKYFSIYCSRINELIIRKWVANREFLKLWSLLLCNFKVKTIAEQFLKCGISISELTCFFRVEDGIVKEFLEYLITKDKYKFKLALFTCGLAHRKELVDYSLPDVII